VLVSIGEEVEVEVGGGVVSRVRYEAYIYVRSPC